MKKRLSIAMAGLLAAGSLLIAQPSFAADVVIPDARLRECIAGQLGKSPTAPISQVEAAGMDEMWCTGGVTNLSGLEQFVNLTHVGVAYGTIDDFGPLEQLSYLVDLDLEGSQLGDLSPIANLVNLEVLDVSYGNLLNIEALRGFTQLKSLNLFRNSISDLSPLSGLESLEFLNASVNPLDSFEALRGLPNLVDVSAANTGISDLSPLADKTKLKFITMHNSNVSDISPVATLHPTLIRGYFDGNHIVDLSSLITLNQSQTNVSVRNQTVSLPDLPLGRSQHNVIREQDGSVVVPTSTTANYDSATSSWSYATEGPHTLTWDSDPGTTWTGFTGTITQNSVAALPVGVAPTVTLNPADQSVIEGESARFSVEADGDLPMTVRWQESRDAGVSWTDLPLAVNLTLQLDDVVLAQHGNQYRVTLTNTEGAATSAAATLTVTAQAVVPPIIPPVVPPVVPPVTPPGNKPATPPAAVAPGATPSGKATTGVDGGAVPPAILATTGAPDLLWVGGGMLGMVMLGCVLMLRGRNAAEPA
ncbi:leucine-rich repeat domain-containing protein [Lysinibacter cavernae]|uniref:Ig-like domain-containing protein n=1 Tax=Lysinibacter cavernae TaxID=1640652 RepID=A0A7X5TSF3_9MICO|nr:leucine-rich repeat domain-containing protein [Lysinibacter cavernae]NIH52930.1 hypothetical protein [Lysinibacter cavernae]